MASSNPLILVDGSSYLYRAFFASQQADLRTSTGLPSGAVRVMANMMRSLRKQYPDCHVAVVFDAKGKTFRDDIYPEYKATRASMPDDLRSQVAPIHQMIKAMGFPFLMVEGVEADDVIGTLARQATEKQLPVLISTGDKDMAQLVSDHVTLIDTMKDVKTDREGVIEKFGVPPELIIDYLALMGDKVDNIPGMAGVGEKTAQALLQGIGSIDQIAANLDKVAALGFRGSKAFADKFREQEEQVRLSYQLATIKTDVALEQSLEELLLGPIDKESLLAVYREYELRNLIKELESGGEEGAGQEEAADDVGQGSLGGEAYGDADDAGRAQQGEDVEPHQGEGFHADDDVACLLDYFNGQAGRLGGHFQGGDFPEHLAEQFQKYPAEHQPNRHMQNFNSHGLHHFQLEPVRHVQEVHGFCPDIFPGGCVCHEIHMKDVANATARLKGRARIPPGL